MKKKYVILIPFLFTCCTLWARQKPSQFFAEISLGPSVPIGQFAEKTYTGNEDDQPGMAGVGMSVNATLGYYITKNVGLLLTAGYSSNKQKPEGLEEYLQKTYFPAGADVEVTTTSWNIRKVMVGGFYITPLTEDKLNFITKLSAGICTPIVPGYDWKAKNIVGGAGYATGGVGKDRLNTTLCYQISLGLQYKLNDRLHLLFDINSFNANATNKGAQRSGGQLPDTRVKTGMVNALLGVGLNF